MGTGRGGAPRPPTPARARSGSRAAEKTRPSRWTRLWAALFVLRAANALAVRTVFAPDDVWQSLEVAHVWAFGYGEVTWEWIAGIRGSLHVLPFALAYRLLRMLRLDAPWVVRATPRVLQAAIAASADLAVVRIAEAAFAAEEVSGDADVGAARGEVGRPTRADDGAGAAAAGRRDRQTEAARSATGRCAILAGLPPAARWTLACQVLSWFDAYALTRTSSNAAEAALVAWGVLLFLAAFFEAPSRLRAERSSQRAPRGPTREGGRLASDGAGAHAERRDAPGRPGRESPAHRRRALVVPWRHLSWLLVASLCVVVRPSSGAFWALPGALAVLEEWRRATSEAADGGSPLLPPLALALLGLGTCASFLFLGALLDRAAPFPHRWTCAPLEFLRFNVLHGGAERYGTAPWGWLVVAGVPGILGSYAIVLLWGGWKHQRLRSESPSGTAENAARRRAARASGHSPHRGSAPAPPTDAHASRPAATPPAATGSARPTTQRATALPVASSPPRPAALSESPFPPSAWSPPLAPDSALFLWLAPRGLLLALALWSCVACTLSKHKEHRFLIPCLQLAMPFVGRACEDVWGRQGTEAAKRPPGKSVRRGASEPPSDSPGLDLSSISTRPETADASAISTRPETADASAISTRPEAADASAISTRPEAADASAISTRPEAADASAISTRPEAADASAISTRPEAADASAIPAEDASTATASSSTASSASAGPPPPAGTRILHESSATRLCRRRATLLFLLALQPTMAAYFCCVHQGGQLSVLRELERLRERHEVVEARAGVASATPSPPRFAALFLTPCHATPWQSALHDPTSSYRFLDCSPPEYADGVERANRAARSWFRVPWKPDALETEEKPGTAERPTCDSAASPSHCHAPRSNDMENERQWFERAHPSHREALATLLRANPSAAPTAVVAFREAELDRALEEQGYALERSVRNCWIQTEDDYPCGIGLWARTGRIEQREEGRPEGSSMRGKR